MFEVGEQDTRDDQTIIAHVDFFPPSEFYRDRHNNSFSNAQSGANLRPTQDRSSAYTCMYA